MMCHLPLVPWERCCSVRNAGKDDQDLGLDLETQIYLDDGYGPLQRATRSPRVEDGLWLLEQRCC